MRGLGVVKTRPVVIVVMGLVCLLAPGAAVGAQSAGFGDPLVVSGVQVLDGGQQAEAAREARLASPGSVQALESSQTGFEGLGAGAAGKLAQEAFPTLVDEKQGGVSELPVGARVVGYPSPSFAQVEFAGGSRGVVDSTEPVAATDASGQRVGLDLGLVEAGGVFEPRAAAAGVRIPKQLGDGVSLTGPGVALVPVDGQGGPLEGAEGSLLGASVFFGGTGTDVDTVVKPLPTGFEADTLLRGVDSPEHLYFRVVMPQGASLRLDGASVEVVDEGQLIAAVVAPSASDAAGRNVPISVGVSGDVVELSVAHPTGAFEYPIDVDPTIVDTALDYYDNWEFGGKEGTRLGATKQIGPERLVVDVPETPVKKNGAR